MVAIAAGELLDVFKHSNQQRYPGQLVPYVRTTVMPEQPPAIQLDSREQNP